MRKTLISTLSLGAKRSYVRNDGTDAEMVTHECTREIIIRQNLSRHRLISLERRAPQQAPGMKLRSENIFQREDGASAHRIARENSLEDIVMCSRHQANIS